MRLESAANMRRSPSQLQLRVVPLFREETWEELEDDLLIILNGRTDHLAQFHQLHNEGLTWSNLLRSAAYLASKPSKKEESIYFEHISTVASFLSIGRAKRELKLSVVKTMISCLSPAEAGWQLRDPVIEGTLDFLTKRKEDWEFMEHTEMILIWELRAMCLRQIEREQERITQVATTGESAAIIISTGAKLMEAGIGKGAQTISEHIEIAGENVKGRVVSENYPLIMDKDAVVAMTYSNAAKRASEGAKVSTRVAVDGICEASTRGLQMVAKALDNDKIAESLPPEGLEVIKAAGKVGVATLGAAAIVGEAIIETSRTVVHKAAEVTADVVQHKYGTSAASVVSDSGETAGNVIRTMGNLALLQSGGLTKAAKNAGKTNVDDEFSKAKDTMRMLEGRARTLLKQTEGFLSEGNLHALAGSSAEILRKTPVNQATESRQRSNSKSSDVSKETSQTDSSSVENTRRSSFNSSSHQLNSNSEASTSQSSNYSTTSSSPATPSNFKPSRISRRGSKTRKKRPPLQPNILKSDQRLSERSVGSTRRGSSYPGDLVPIPDTVIANSIENQN